MPIFSIVNLATNEIISSGFVAATADLDKQQIPPGAVLVNGIMGIPSLHKVVNRALVDIPQIPQAEQVDRVDLLIEVLKSKGIILSTADLSAAKARIQARG